MEEWNAIDPGSIRRLMQSMPRLCRECIQGRVAIPTIVPKEKYRYPYSVPATEQCFIYLFFFFIIMAILNTRNIIHDMVNWVNN